MNKIDVFVGKRIRARRYALGISQAELGDAIGVRFQQIQKYETGANRVSASRLWAVAAKLGVDVEYFFDGIRPGADNGKAMAEPVDHLEFLSDEDAVQVVELYRKLPHTQRDAVLAIMRSMAIPAKQQNLGMAT